MAKRRPFRDKRIEKKLLDQRHELHGDLGPAQRRELRLRLMDDFSADELSALQTKLTRWVAEHAGIAALGPHGEGGVSWNMTQRW